MILPELLDVLSKGCGIGNGRFYCGGVARGGLVKIRIVTNKITKCYKEIITGYPLILITIAGKTGNYQNNSDGWFMGMVPN